MFSHQMNPESTLLTRRTPWAPAGEPASRQFIHPQFSLQEFLWAGLMEVWACAAAARQNRATGADASLMGMVLLLQEVGPGVGGRNGARGGHERPDRVGGLRHDRADGGSKERVAGDDV